MRFAPLLSSTSKSIHAAPFHQPSPDIELSRMDCWDETEPTIGPQGPQADATHHTGAVLVETCQSFA
jgi:hypothetical protein